MCYVHWTDHANKRAKEQSVDKKEAEKEIRKMPPFVGQVKWETKKGETLVLVNSRHPRTGERSVVIVTVIGFTKKINTRRKGLGHAHDWRVG